MVLVQRNNQKGLLFSVIPAKIVEAMNIKKGDQIVFVSDSLESGRFQIIR